MFDFLKNELRKRKPAKKVELVKVRGDGSAKVLFFAFFNNDFFPKWCLKTDSSLIKREFDNLIFLKDFLPDNLKETLPKPIDLFEADGRLISVEEAVIGWPASFQSGPRELKKVFDWLLDFHKANFIAKKMISQSFLMELLSGYQEAVPELKRDLRFLPAVKNFIEKNWPEEMELPLIKQHGDFHFGNIFFKDISLKIVDWPNYGRVVLPAYDVIFFLRRQSEPDLENNKFLLDYFDFFSLPKEILSSWLKIEFIIEGLERWSKKGEFISSLALNNYFKEELV